MTSRWTGWIPGGLLSRLERTLDDEKPAVEPTPHAHSHLSLVGARPGQHPHWHRHAPDQPEHLHFHAH